MRVFIRTIAGVLTLTLVAIACSSDSDDAGGGDDPCSGGGSGACPTPVDVPDTVSLRTHVMPILRRSCGLSTSCHGSPTNSAADLYQGPKLADANPTDAQITEIHAALVGDSFTASGSKLVVPGQPDASFWYLKLDGRHMCDDDLAATCEADGNTEHPCGDTMPPASPKLCDAELEILRKWIEQGAEDN